MSYTGKCLYIDLTKATCTVKETEKDLLKKYIGGKGLGFALLERDFPSGDPFDPANPLIFVNGPFTGTKVQTSARTALVTKSPLTNAAHDGHCGGNFGPVLKAAGYDYLHISGKSSDQVYLLIVEDKIEILDASDLWCQGIFATTDELMKKHKGTNTRVAAIGPAGENLSYIACIGVDKHRQYGRGGVGAVMGSKNLKAIVVDGNIPVKYHNEALFNEVNLKYTKEILNLDGIKFRRLKGTMKCVRSCQNNEILPVKNFSKVQFEKFEDISSETARKELNWEDTSCFNCSIRCSKWARWDGHEIEGPEYESAALLGSSCEVGNIKDIALSNEICNDLGLDTISAGSTVAFAMECYDKKLFNDWDGLKLEWGNAKGQQDLLVRLAYRSGAGIVFADGSLEAARRIGKNSADYAMNIAGMELSGINPLGSLTMGVAMAVADFASHTRLWIAESEMGPDFTIGDIIPAVTEGIDTVNVRNCLVICDFVPLNLDKLADILNAATGSSHSGSSLLATGTAITHLARRYNVRNGRSSQDDILPGRFFKELSQGGFMKGKVLDKEYFKTLVRDYYLARNWNENGEPDPEVLKQFSL